MISILFKTHNRIYTQWKVCRASLWNTHTLMCVIYAGYFPVTPMHTLWDVWPLMHPSCGHIHCALQFSESFKAHRKKGGGVCIWLYLCGFVCVCVCIIVYVWVFVYVYMVLFLWVGLCMHVWPFQQYKLSLQERCMIRENDVTLSSYHTRLKTELNCVLTVFLGFAPLCYCKENTSRNHLAYCYAESKSEDIDSWAISLLHYLRWRLHK